MNGSNVVATLTSAINSLEARGATLAPIERVKLKTLRLNLEAVMRSVPVPTPCDVPRHATPDLIEQRFRTLHALSVTAFVDTRSLLQEVQQHIARARSLAHDVRQALTYSELTCATICKTLSSSSRQVHPASYLSAQEQSQPILASAPST